MEQRLSGRDVLLADLNPAQREAVTHPGGPLLIVAGAGSGKTRVLTRRVGWLVAGGLPGPALLAITFTNKAAQVLRSRLADLPGAAGVWAGTFHGFAAWLLRRYGAALPARRQGTTLLGFDPHFTIADREDSQRLLKTLLDERGLAAFKPKAAALISWISRTKNGPTPLPREWAREAEALQGLARAYDERLRAAGLLDFDDLLLEARRALREGPGVADALKARFAHVLVDEYQDTNLVQRDLLLALLGPSRNLTVVGDPDQSIYRWRGATVANILKFADDLPGARTVVLDRNYRTTARLLDAAEGVISKNRGRFAKRLTAERVAGERVRVVRATDARDEADVVAEAALRWIAQGGRAGDMAVIYRVNALSRAVELALRARGVAYHVVAGVEFFQRQEVKDALAYARLVENPRDEAAFARVANVPTRGVGATSLGRVRALAAARGVGWIEVARGEPEGVPKKAREALRTLADLIESVRRLPRAPVAPLLETLLERSGYLAALAAEGADPEGARADNVRELLAAAHDFDHEPPGPDEGAGDLGRFLETTGLVSDQDGLEEDADRVSLLSAHSAKGLEFPFVVLLGAEQGLFPHARSMEEDAALEEERRLFYVAMTRAKDRLLVTHAAWRFGAGGAGMGGFEPRLPSPFLRDMPAASVEGEDRAGRLGARAWDGPGAGTTAWDRDPDDGGGALREAGPAYDVGDAGRDVPEIDRGGGDLAPDGLAPGDRVRHPVFGIGRLEALTGSAGARRLTIDFESCGRKQLIPGFARLERLP